MTHPLPRSLTRRWLFLLFSLGLITIAIALGLEQFWSQVIAFDPIADWRFWLALLSFVCLVDAMAFVISKHWLQQPTRLPTQTDGDFTDQPPLQGSSLEEAHALQQALLTQQQQKEAEMIELRNFVANASHELRTPLTTLKLRVEALLNGAMQEPALAEKFLREMESEIDHLSQLVVDMLDLSRIEATKGGVPFTEINLKRVIFEVCAAFQIRAEKSKIQIQIEAGEDLPMISGVEDQIRRLVYNLVDNAIKYTPNGGWVKVRLHAQPATHTLVLEVEDNGFGIPPNYLPHIFERFYRAEATRPRYGTTRGSGLGLAIVKAIVDSHGGKISAESEVGKGSLFRVEFPTCSA
ncbi:MAG: hypothetical protein DDG59_10890 [Anaerolineae bacterium]|jgi:signal transduction histidine kinase|nr:MAG: hypothetical protein DDG59_10890 [Anaerolineae bacterium]